MSFYIFVLFLHITGALGIFIGIGLEWFLVHNFGKATTYSGVVQWTDSFKVLPPIFSVSGILILISGIYLSVESWGMNAWTISGLVLFLLIAVFGSVIVSKKIDSIIKLLDLEKENLSEAFINRIKSPLITQSLKIRAALALSIVFIMTTKPDWTVTLIVVGVALALGFLLTRILK
ncbi:MAG TPA: hypothetical protein VKA26_14355 [Ignavibacteriaceae bacterium]|nr:hypothetical protein [Ignavibacteriaceae bacterium]